MAKGCFCWRRCSAQITRISSNTQCVQFKYQITPKNVSLTLKKIDLKKNEVLAAPNSNGKSDGKKKIPNDRTIELRANRKEWLLNFQIRFEYLRWRQLYEDCTSWRSRTTHSCSRSSWLHLCCLFVFLWNTNSIYYLLLFSSCCSKSCISHRKHIILYCFNLTLSFFAVGSIVA